MPDYI